MSTPMQRLTATLATLTALGMMGLSHATNTLQIAVIGPITGSVAQYGDMQMAGAKMAVAQINAAGGVNGQQLEAVLMDDVCEPKQAVAVANRVVNQGIQFVVGHLCSGSTQPASDIYEDERILMITPASTSPAITERGHQMVLRTIGLDSQQGPVAGRYIADVIKPRNLAIIHDKQQYGQGIADQVGKTVMSSDVNVVMYEGVNKDQKNFSALITKMKSRGVDFVYYGGYHPELGLILRQAREQGLQARFMGPEGVGNKDISTIAGEASEGLLVTLPADFTLLPTNRGLVQAFTDAGEDPSGPFVMPAYTAVQVIADAIKATGSTDPEVIAHHLRNSEFKTPIGNIAFDHKGDLKQFEFVIFNWHADASKTAVQ